MKKDNMLNESTIRRFMKLATIDGLSDKFVAENLDEANEEELEERGGPKPSMKRDEDEMREGEEEELDEMRGDKDKAAMRGDKEEKAMRDDDDDKAMRHDKKVNKEELELEVIDDEELTEAVLKRVVERLLRRQ